MKNIENFNKIHKKNLRVAILFLCVAVSIIGLFLLYIHMNKINNVIKEEAQITLEAVSSQNIINLKSNISSKEDLLRELVKNIENNKNFDIESIIKKLKSHSEVNGFYNMGIIDKSGMCYTTLDQKLDLSDHDYFINGINGISQITSGYISEDGKEILNIFTVPIYKEDKVEMILTATYKASDFSKLINITSFKGKGKSVVVDSSGNLVSQVNNLNENKLEVIQEFDTNNILNILKECIDKSGKNIISYEYKDEEYLAYCEKIGINDWHLISYAPKKEIYKNISTINKIALSGYIIVYISMIIFLFIFFMEYIKYQKRISKIIFIDELTNEKNSEYMKLYFKYMSKKDKLDKYIVVMDIDKFKNINIMHGSDTGDKLLKYIPLIFKELLPNDEIFKYQADVFACIISGVSQEDIINKISKVQNRIREDIEKKLIVSMNLSFGVCSLQEFEDLHSIYNNALISKNEIKGNVNKKVNFFNEDNKNKIIENRKFESKFIDSLKNNEFEVWYQPKYDMKTNEICGAEALIRWREKDGQLISPAKFIPVFENSGQILQLDEVVIETTFKDIKEMDNLGLPVKPISINLSRMHVEHIGIVDKIRDLMKKYEVNPSYISFEITESALIKNNYLINKIVLKLQEIGFQVDIDDYGVGSSTLNSIYSSNFDTLKLDKSFVDNIGDLKMDIIIKSTINMANELGMKIVAEGVENKNQVEFLINNNCSIAQGYYYSKPLDKLSYFELLKKKDS